MGLDTWAGRKVASLWSEGVEADVAACTDIVNGQEVADPETRFRVGKKHDSNRARPTVLLDDAALGGLDELNQHGYVVSAIRLGL